MKKIVNSILSHKASPVFLIIASTAVIQAINSIILGRILGKEDFGLYSFLFTSTVPLIASILIMGQNASIVRYFSKRDFKNYKWKNYFRRISVFFSISITIATFLVFKFYRLSIIYFAYLFIAIFSNVLIFVISSFLKTKKKFITATLIESSAPIIFLLLIFLAIAFKGENILCLSTFKTISYFSVATLILFLFLKKEKSGTRIVNKSIYLDGALLWGLGLTNLAMVNMDNFFIAKILDYKAVAVYSIIMIFVRIYDFVIYSLWTVYSQKFATAYKPNPLRFLLKITAIAITISAFYLIAGKPLLHFLFNGKYDYGIYLLLPFCIIGCLKLLYLYPACYFLGKASPKTLKVFLKLNGIAILIKIAFLFVLIKYFGLMGVLVSGIIAWVFRNVVSYYLIIKNRYSMVKK